MKIHSKLRNLLPYLAALISCLPILLHGYPRGHDWSLELIRVAEYTHAIQEGQVPPHWAPNLYFGFGSPVFLFYSPLFVALASAIAAVVGSVVTASSIAIVLASLLGVWAVLRLVAAVPGTTPEAGRFAATLYALHPYLIGDKLLRNANAELLALCLLPIVLLGLLRLADRPSRGALILAVGTSLCLLSHNLTALVALALVVFGGIWLYRFQGSGSLWIRLAAGLAVGLLIASFLVLPGMALQPLIRVEDLLRGKFEFQKNWAPWSAFFGYRQFFSAGILMPIAWLTAVGAAYRTGNAGSDRSDETRIRQRFLIGMIVAAVVFVVMQRPVSSPAWHHLPYLALMQFPWRFMGPLALVTSVAGGLALGGLLSRRTRAARRWVEVVVLVLCLANAWPLMSKYRALDPVALDGLPTSLDSEFIRRHSFNVTAYDEYLPRGADLAVIGQRVSIQDSELGPDAKRRQVEVVEDSGSALRVRKSDTSKVRLVLGRWFFPGWRAEWSSGVGVERVETEQSADGRVAVDLPRGEGELALTRTQPRARRAGLLMSLSGLVLLVALWALDRYENPPSRS